MKRFIVRVRNQGYNAQDIPRIRELLGKIDGKFANIRVSNKAIEFDYFGEDSKIIQALERGLGPVLDFYEINDSAFEKKTIGDALKLYREERFWEAHEVLEVSWKKENDTAKKELIQSLILLCAAYVHFQKGRNSVSLGILRRAREKISRYLDEGREVAGIDFKDIKEKLDQIIAKNSIEMINIASSSD